MTELDRLNKLIAEARAKMARLSTWVRWCQRRLDHFKERHKWAKGKAEYWLKRGKPESSPRVRYFRAIQSRCARKIRLWAKREATAIEANRSTKAWLRRLRRKKAALQPQGGNLVAKARSYVGTQEGGAQQRAWAANLGYSSYLPWCSIFVANMLLEVGLDTKSSLPANPAYSGAWFAWGGGRRVNESERQAGDIVIFDWGDGGMTDHVAIYAGSGRHIGGNQSNAVTETSTPSGNIVGVIRPV
jgi:CHAP domain